MIKTKNKNNFFLFILTLIILFFSIIIFLSIPVLFNYKSIESQLEKKFYSEFNINLKILDEIKYNFLPQPHLLINKANLNITSKNANSSNIETEKLKIFLSLRNLYSKSNLKFNKVEIQNTNFKLNLHDIKILRDHLYNKKNNQIIVSKSKIFLNDKDNNTILISPINKLSYLINLNENYKKLIIKGNIFDIDYESLWKRYYEKPKKSHTEIKFKNPNLFLKNLLEFDNSSKFKGKVLVNFLNESFEIDYSLNEQKIKIETPDLNQKIGISSNINLDPFYFDSKIYISQQNLKFLIDEFFYILINYNPELLGNLNGNLSINLDSIDNEFVDRGNINISVNEKSIDVKDIFFKIDGGHIASKILYLENEGELIFMSKNSLEIKNKKKFAKKLQIKVDKIKDIRKINFNLLRNIDTGKISISEIKIDDLNNNKLSNQIYNVNNIQELRSLLKTILNS